MADEKKLSPQAQAIQTRIDCFTKIMNNMQDRVKKETENKTTQLAQEAKVEEIQIKLQEEIKKKK